MRQQRIVWVCSMLVVALLGTMRLDHASARPAYYKAFKKKYLGTEKTKVQQALAAEIKRVKRCNICHDPRKNAEGKASKKNRNPYGAQLAKMLAKKNERDLDKVLQVLTKAEKVKLKGSEKTIGQLLNSGKLPFEYKPKK